jgi:hypothetical protein
MDFLLEILGLEYLLGDGGDDFFSGMISGVFAIIGMILWLIMLVFKSHFVDQCVVLCNLLVAIFFIIANLLCLFADFISKKSRSKIKSNKKILDIITFCVMLIAFIYGLNHTYHALIFSYEYKPIFSGIATTLYPLVIMNIISNIFVRKGIKEKIVVSFKIVGVTLFGFVVTFLISTYVSIILSICGQEQIVDKVMTYHSINYDEAREKSKFNNEYELLQYYVPIAFEHYDNLCQEEGYDEERCSNTKKDKVLYYIFSGSKVETDFGYSLYEHNTWEDDNKELIIVDDYEYGTLSYYRLNYQTHDLEPITEEYYKQIKNQNNKN